MAGCPPQIRWSSTCYHPGRSYCDQMLGTGWTEAAALPPAFVIAVLAAMPAGISGAVLLLPFQVSVLGTPSPAVTPTNLLYNVVATPGALYRYWRQGQTGASLPLILIAGTLPGVIAGICHPRGTAAECPRLRPRGRGRTAAARRMVGPNQATPGPETGTQAGLRSSTSRAHPARGRGGLRGRDLRHRRRLDPGTDPHRHRKAAPGSCPGCSGVHFRDLSGGRHHLLDPVGPSPRGQSPPTGRPESHWASAAWRARTPVPGSSGTYPTPLIRRVMGVLGIP